MRFLIPFLVAGMAWGQSCASVTPGWDWDKGSKLNGFKWFPNSKMWQKINAAPVSPNSSAWITEIGNQLDPEPSYRMFLFGALVYTTKWFEFVGYNPNPEIMVVDGSKQPKVYVYCGGYGDEWPGSGPQCYAHDGWAVPLPIPANPRVQGKCYRPGEPCWGYNTIGDKHVVVLDTSNCSYIEMYNTWIKNGKLFATTITVHDALGSDLQRPFGRAAGSQAGAPWFAGALRIEEVRSGLVEHAIHMVGWGGAGNNSGYADATYSSNTGGSANHTAPYGARLRLKASYDYSGWPSAQARTIAKAMQDYGVILVDGGQLQLIHEGSQDWDWPNIIYGGLSEWGFFQPSNWEVVEPGDYRYTPVNGPLNWPSGSAPAFTSFNANGTAGNISITKGQSVTLAWTASGIDSTVNNLALVDWVGVIRGAAKGSVVLSGAQSPVTTTTYRVRVNNRFGEAVSAPITVTVN